RAKHPVLQGGVGQHRAHPDGDEPGGRPHADVQRLGAHPAGGLPAWWRGLDGRAGVPDPRRVRAAVGAEPGRSVGRGATASAWAVAHQRGVPEALAGGLRESRPSNSGLRRGRPHSAAGAAEPGGARRRARQPPGGAGSAGMTAPVPRETPRAAFVDALTRALGPAAVSTAPEVVQGFLKDNSWLSPILAEYFERGRGEGGDVPGVDVVASPRDGAQLRDAIALAARHGVPITPRGAGTSNFGGSIPLSGGMLLDLTRLNRVRGMTDASIPAEAGALVGDLERAARERGKDMTLLTTTYGTATIGGWVAGGHVGIGTSAYGTIWDGNVLAVTLLTA